MRRLLIAGMVLLALAFAAMAADSFTGKWTLEQAGRGGGGSMVTTYDLKADGSALTGTVTMPGFGGMEAPPPAQIQNGKISGNVATFEVTREFGDMKFTQKYECVIQGDELVVKQVTGTAKRAK